MADTICHACLSHPADPFIRINTNQYRMPVRSLFLASAVNIKNLYALDFHLSSSFPYHFANTAYFGDWEQPSRMMTNSRPGGGEQQSERNGAVCRKISKISTRVNFEHFSEIPLHKG